MAHWQRTELWVVLELESSSELTKLIGLIDGIEVERLVTKMGLEWCEKLRCSACVWCLCVVTE